MNRRALLICIDGCGIEYLQFATFLKRIIRDGYFVKGSAMVPSVTNVNNVSIITGVYPERHGITSNYYYDRKTGREIYMESPDFIRAVTIFEICKKMGLRSALLTSKDKLRSLLDKGATISISAEKPPEWIIKKVGSPPPIYSIDVNIWLFKVAKEIILKEDPHLIYIVTTDYAMHKYAPEHEESKRHIRGIDQAIQELVELYELKGRELLLCVTADHGMSNKEKVVNLELILKEHNIHSKMNPIIADRYVVHHSNLGGAVYIYLKEHKFVHKAIDILEEIEGVEVVLSRRQAAKLFHLDEERIGDILVLGEKNYVFGLVDQEVVKVSLRSHGSLHEVEVPIIMNRKISELEKLPSENKDLAPLVMDWLRRKSN